MTDFASESDIVTATNDTLPIDPFTFASAAINGLLYSVKTELTASDDPARAALYGVVSAKIPADAVRGSVAGGGGSALVGTVSGAGGGYGAFLMDASGNNRGLYVAGNIVTSGSITTSDSSLKLNQEPINPAAAIAWSKQLAWVDFTKYHDPSDISGHNFHRRQEHSATCAAKLMAITQSKNTANSLASSLTKATNDLAKANASIVTLNDLLTQATAANATPYVIGKLEYQITKETALVAHLTATITTINADLAIANEAITQTTADHALSVASTPTPTSTKVEASNTAIAVGEQAGLIAQQVQALILSTGYGSFVIKTLPSGLLALDYMSVLAIVNQGLQLRLAAIEKFLSMVDGSGITV